MPAGLPGLLGIDCATTKRSWNAGSLIGRTVLMFAMLSAIAFIQIRWVVSAEPAVANSGNIGLPIYAPSAYRSCRIESLRTRNLLFIDSVASWYRSWVSIAVSVSPSTLTLLPFLWPAWPVEPVAIDVAVGLPWEIGDARLSSNATVCAV